MMVMHDVFRHEFALLPGLVAGVAAGDHARRQAIGDHVEALISVLNHHHRERRRVRLADAVDRCPDAEAALTGAMEEQHEHVAARLHDVGAALSAWRVTVTADSRKNLVNALDRLIPPLKQHLSDEELRVVPLMERYITAADFIEIVRKGAADADPNVFALGFGMLMYEGDPDIIDRAIVTKPAEIHPVIKAVAAQAFADHSQRIHGTATPPRSTELGAA
jgi:hemerythrin-like domain-containing protein